MRQSNPKNQTRSNITQLLLLWPLIKQAISAISAETMLAGKSLKTLFGFFFLKIIFILTAWFLAMIALALYLATFLNLNLIESLFAVAVLNLFLAGIVWLCIKRKRRSLVFTSTRKKLRSTFDTEHAKAAISYFARKNPLATISAAVIMGAGLAFLLKPKQERSQHQDEN